MTSEQPGRFPTRSRTLLGAAAFIATLTILARIVGFARTAVLGRTVGADCVGSVYQTTNTLPNIVFDVVAGGTLAAVVVPLLAADVPGVDDGHDDGVDRSVTGELGLTRRAAGGVEDHLPFACPDGVDRDHVAPCLGVFGIELPDHQHLHPLHEGLFPAGDQRPDDTA